MKRLIALIFIMVMAFAACSEQAADPTTVATTTAKPAPTTLPVSPGSLLEEILAVYDQYTKKTADPCPAESVLFGKDGSYYILSGENRVYQFFEEGATEDAEIYKSGDYTLYSCPFMEDTMILAMRNAWEKYAQKSTDIGEKLYDLHLYQFECSYFNGVFALDEDEKLVQNAVIGGVTCGNFGPFLIYRSDNADNVQQNQNPDQSISDGDLIVMLRNTYNQFAQDRQLDAEEYEDISYYIFQFGGTYYRMGDSLEKLDAQSVDGLATEKQYNGWMIYLPAQAAE